MHKLLKSKLPAATGSADFVVVIFLDVRRFTTFAGMVDSINGALFLRSIYTRILERYFPDVTFFKLTGDGMMIIRKYTPDTLTEIVNDSIRQSIALVEGFAELTNGDAMINFGVPENLGIGIARASATCLSSGRLILDYSGRPLNLAARLMDLARPSGVVFGSDSIGLSIIEPDLVAQFSTDSVYLRGIAESESLPIHYLTSRTKIDASSHLPINKFKTKRTPIEMLTTKSISERSRFFHQLPEKPDVLDRCKILFTYPKSKPNGTKIPGLSYLGDYKVEYAENAGVPGVFFDYPSFVTVLKNRNVKSTWPITMQIEYTMMDIGSIEEKDNSSSGDADDPPF